MTLPNDDSQYAWETLGIDVTCSAWEEFVFVNYTSDSNECFLAQEMNWECGCNNGFYGYLGTTHEWQKLGIIWAGRFAAFWSFMGVGIILQDFIACPHKTLYRELLVLMACFDALTAMAWIWGPYPISSEYDGILGANGDNQTCTLQGFVVALGYGSIWVCGILIFHFYLIVVRQWTDKQLEHARPWLLTIPIVATLFVACVGIPHYDQIWATCYLQPYPFTTQRHLLYLSALPIVLVLVCCCTLQILMYQKLRVSLRTHKWGAFLESWWEPDCYLEAEERRPRLIRAASESASVGLSSLNISLGSADLDKPIPHREESLEDKSLLKELETEQDNFERAFEESSNSIENKGANLADLNAFHSKRSDLHVREDGRRPGYMRRASERSLWTEDSQRSLASTREDGRRPGFMRKTSGRSLRMETNDIGKTRKRPELFRNCSDHDVTRSPLLKRPVFKKGKSVPSLWKEDEIDMPLCLTKKDKIKVDDSFRQEDVNTKGDKLESQKSVVPSPTSAASSVSNPDVEIGTGSIREVAQQEMSQWVSNRTLIAMKTNLHIVRKIAQNSNDSVCMLQSSCQPAPSLCPSTLYHVRTVNLLAIHVLFCLSIYLLVPGSNHWHGRERSVVVPLDDGCHPFSSFWFSSLLYLSSTSSSPIYTFPHFSTPSESTIAYWIRAG
jgi:hypothetical protein